MAGAPGPASIHHKPLRVPSLAKSYCLFQSECALIIDAGLPSLVFDPLGDPSTRHHSRFSPDPPILVSDRISWYPNSEPSTIRLLIYGSMLFSFCSPLLLLFSIHRTILRDPLHRPSSLLPGTNNRYIRCTCNFSLLCFCDGWIIMKRNHTCNFGIGALRLCMPSWQIRLLNAVPCKSPW